MKKVFSFLFLLVTLAFLFSSCEEEEKSFDESLLIGKWVSGTVHYKYLSDHTGGTWDTADDVYEDEAQKFTWTLDKADLTQIHIMEIGGNVPKYYTVDELTSTTLKYHEGNNSFTFTKE